MSGDVVVVAEVARMFERYEQALRQHDIEALNDFFLASADAVRFGVAEQNYGIEAIRTYRRTSAPVHPQRRLQHTVIVALNNEVACVSTEFTDPLTTGVGRQSQTWVRTAAGWKIAMAHVSVGAPQWSGASTRACTEPPPAGATTKPAKS